MRMLKTVGTVYLVFVVEALAFSILPGGETIFVVLVIVQLAALGICGIVWIARHVRHLGPRQDWQGAYLRRHHQQRSYLDMITDPAWSLMPGNIYHDSDIHADDIGIKTTDLYNDPENMWFEGNAFHVDDHPGG